jgi:hypothetical protein
VQGKNVIKRKKLAQSTKGSKKMYRKSHQGRQLNIFDDFHFPFAQQLDPSNRWVIMSEQIPWTAIENEYAKLFESDQGPLAKDVRIAFGAFLLKTKLNCSDSELVAQVSENPYLQYFLGAKDYSDKPLFGESTLVDFRRRMNQEVSEGVTFLQRANELVLNHNPHSSTPDSNESDQKEETDDDDDTPRSDGVDNVSTEREPSSIELSVKNQGNLILDATCIPADIAYPTDVDLLNDSRVKLEAMIDELHISGEKKPRTYRKRARKEYLRFARAKGKGAKKIRQAKRQQLEHVRRDISYVENFLAMGRILPEKLLALFFVIQCIYGQQKQMFDEKTTTVSDRIVSLYQPHVRPIIRGKKKARTEFGAKVEISVVNGYVRREVLSWDAFNESEGLKASARRFYERYGFYPKAVIVDQIYRTRANRKFCKEHGIRLSGKPLGRPKKDETVDKQLEYLDNSERNIVEGKFGEAKIAYGLDRLSTRTKQTCEAEIDMAIIVMNLSRLVREHFLPFFKLSFG